MEEKKKDNKGLIIIIVILVIVLLGLGFYILVDKDIIKLKSITEVEDKEEPKEKIEELDVNNENIKDMFNTVHDSFVFGNIDSEIYGNKKLSTSEMENNYKFKLAGRIFYDKMNQISSSNEMMIYEIAEEDVKSAYERIFGPNSYNQVSKFSLGCGDYNYDSNKKVYSLLQPGCGGTTSFGAFENIIKVLKYEDRIEIIGAVVFADQETSVLYKDYSRTTKLSEFNCATTNYETYFETYINDNKDNLQQYTYTFKLGDDGFYYYTGFERTKD